MTKFLNNLQEQLRVMNLQKNFYREEFERHLQIANQHNVVIHTDEEYNSYCHRLRRNLPKSNIRADGSSRTTWS